MGLIKHFGGVVTVLVAAFTVWATSGCAYYQFRVWPDYSVLDASASPSPVRPNAPSQQPPTTGTGAAADGNPIFQQCPLDSILSPDDYHNDWFAAHDSLCRTLFMAKALEARYNEYGRTHERTGPMLLTILGPILATIAGLAITGTTGAPIAALSLAGGVSSAYAIGLSSVPRERIYAEGKVATRCLIDTYEPIFPPEKQYRDFRTLLDTGALLEDKRVLDKAIADVRAQYSSSTPMPVDVADVVKAAESLAKTLEDLNSSALRGGRYLRDSSKIFRDQLRELTKQINKALEKTELDSATLKSNLVSALAASDLSSVTGTKSTTDKAKAQGNAAKSATSQPGVQAMMTLTPPDPIKRLETATNKAAADIATIGVVLDRIGDNPLQSAKVCVDAATAAVQVQPLALDLVAVALSPGDQAAIAITGGVRPYTATPLGEARKVLEVKIDEQNAAFGKLTLTASKTAAAGNYAVEVSDHTRTSTRAVSVQIRPAGGLAVGAAATTLVQGDAFTVRVSGGSGKYELQVLGKGSPLGDVTSQIAPSETVVSAVVKATAEPGEYSFQIRDQETGLTSKPFTLTVRKKS